MAKQHYQVLVMRDGLVPQLEGPRAKSWEELETDVIRVLKDEEFHPGKDNLFLVLLDTSGHLQDIEPFNEAFLDQMDDLAAAD